MVYLITLRATEAICTAAKVDSIRAAFEAELMNQAPYRLDQIRRDAVLEAIPEVEAEVPPEPVMGDFKAG